MAKTKTNAAEKEKAEKDIDTSTEVENTAEAPVVKVIERVIEKDKDTDEIRLDKKVTVRSIASWSTGSARKTTGGDISIAPKGTVLLTREEAIAQSQNGNKLINGIDGMGGHATWYIEDEYVRCELGFETEDAPQEFLTADKVKEIFDCKTQKVFEDHIQSAVHTRAEKAFLLDCIKKLRLNDYGKIAFCERYTGMRVEE